MFAGTVMSTHFPPPPQVDFLTDQQRKLEAELELREKKINDLSRHKVRACVCVCSGGG